MHAVNLKTSNPAREASPSPRSGFGLFHSSRRRFYTVLRCFAFSQALRPPADELRTASLPPINMTAATWKMYCRSLSRAIDDCAAHLRSRCLRERKQKNPVRVSIALNLQRRFARFREVVVFFLGAEVDPGDFLEVRDCDLRGSNVKLFLNVRQISGIGLSQHEPGYRQRPVLADQGADFPEREREPNSNSTLSAKKESALSGAFSHLAFAPRGWTCPAMPNQQPLYSLAEMLVALFEPSGSRCIIRHGCNYSSDFSLSDSGTHESTKAVNRGS